MQKQIYQLTVNNTRYLVQPTSELKQGFYSQNKDQHIRWGTFIGTHGAQGRAIPSDAMRAFDINDQPFMMSSGPWWIDGNHASNDHNYLSLVFYFYSSPVEGTTHFFNRDLCFLVVEDLNIKGTLQTHNLDLKGADLGFWVQCRCNKTGKFGNYFSKQNLNHAISNEPRDFELNLNLKDVDSWISLGSCAERSDVYDDIPIEDLLDDHTLISLGFIIYPYSLKHILQDKMKKSHTANVFLDFNAGYSTTGWPVDTSMLPTGTILMSNLEISYKQNMILTPLG